jgi:hypothetical protein
MSDETSDAGTEPQLEPEGESDQLSAEDTLEDRGVADLLDEGYSPPERPRSNRFGETAWEEAHGETLDQRLAEEEPDVWTRPGGDWAEERRSGRLVADEDALPENQGNDTYAEDVGIDGGAASAEEAAVHIVDEQ